MEHINIVFTAVLWLLLPAAIIYTIYRVVRRGYELKALAERGVESRARVTHKQHFRRKGMSSKRLIYAFKGPDGRNYRHRSLISSKEFETVNIDQEIDIVYLPDKPSINASKAMVEQARAALARRESSQV